ncbi:hypothetical protein O181_033760 [Austropuccinia psidii MF-1]|uniref:Uncharacterized protein n=1 Tax=Austropuccinia psidii MF-1 TaxID=1389203 RepID=A0A9Q3D3M2_9BASI|nr:hypothetical protein [Austropuccinia psidii MF-1]
MIGPIFSLWPSCILTTLWLLPLASQLFLRQGYHPRVNALLTTSFVPAVKSYITLLDQTKSEPAASLSRAKELQARYYARGRRPGEVFQPGDGVLFSRRYISSLHPSSKLDFAYLSQFEVDSMVGCNAARLRISHVYPKFHPVFNMSLVSRYKDPSLNPCHPLPPLEQQVVQFLPALVDWRRVAAVLDFRQFKGQRQYLLRWVRWGLAHDY